MKALITTFFLIFIFQANSRAAIVSTQQKSQQPAMNSPTPIVLTLDQAIQRTLLFNRNLHSAALGIQDSKLNLALANSDFDVKISPLSSIGYTSDTTENTVWQVGSNISKKHNSGISLDLLPTIEYSGENYTSSLGFSLNIPLLRGLGKQSSLNNIYSNEFSLAAAKRSFHTSKVNAVLDTVSQVYNLLRDQGLVKLYKKQVELLKHQLLTSQIKEKSGIISIMDVYRVELRLKDVEGNVSSATESVQETENRLKDVLAIPLQQDIDISAPLTLNLIQMTLTKAIDIALKNRVEVKQAQADIQEARRQEMLARQNILPQLDLVTKYKRQGSNEGFNNSFDLNEDIFSIQLSSNTDFARTAEKTAWSSSQLAVKRKEIAYNNTRENISREVSSVLNSLKKTAELINLRKDQVNKASGKQELAHIKFKYGEADNFDLIEAQTQLQTAKDNFLSEKIKYIIETYRLRAKLGTLIAYEQ